jgi:uncharacterized membrane protein
LTSLEFSGYLLLQLHLFFNNITLCCTILLLATITFSSYTTRVYRPLKTFWCSYLEFQIRAFWEYFLHTPLGLSIALLYHSKLVILSEILITQEMWSIIDSRSEPRPRIIIRHKVAGNNIDHYVQITLTTINLTILLVINYNSVNTY